MVSERVRLDGLVDLLWTGLKKRLPDVECNGPADPQNRVPGILNLRFPGLEGETLVLSLDAKGFATSVGAACATSGSEPSHVLTAMGRSRTEAREVLRLSLGAQNTEAEVRELLEVMPLVAEHLKAMSGLWLGDNQKP
jgi:cysteine desulfurase